LKDILYLQINLNEEGNLNLDNLLEVLVEEVLVVVEVLMDQEI
jgi:hypothetical protein